MTVDFSLCRTNYDPALQLERLLSRDRAASESEVMAKIQAEASDRYLDRQESSTKVSVENTRDMPELVSRLCESLQKYDIIPGDD